MLVTMIYATIHGKLMVYRDDGKEVTMHLDSKTIKMLDDLIEQSNRMRPDDER